MALCNLTFLVSIFSFMLPSFIVLSIAVRLFSVFHLLLFHSFPFQYMSISSPFTNPFMKTSHTARCGMRNDLPFSLMAYWISLRAYLHAARFANQRFSGDVQTICDARHGRERDSPVEVWRNTSWHCSSGSGPVPAGYLHNTDSLHAPILSKCKLREARQRHCCRHWQYWWVGDVFCLDDGFGISVILIAFSTLWTGHITRWIWILKLLGVRVDVMFS